MAAVVLEGVSKRFTLHHDRPRSVQEVFLSTLRRGKGRSSEEFWALRDVSFQIAPGETVGIIGPNGSGKSTILKLISRIIEPTSGRVQVNGQVGALLELGAGFHPDLTGRENIYLNGSILGLTRAQIRRKMEEIVNFAELTRFVDVPVRHYSSGMYVRLGFSVAVHTDPEILLIDETLAVGDQSFQVKCLEKMGELRRRGVTIVLVSHEMTAVRDFCSRVGWMQGGVLKRFDLAELVVPAYLHQASDVEKARLEKEQDQSQQAPATARGTGAIRITRVEMVGPDGKPGWVFGAGERVRVRLHFAIPKRLEVPIFSILIHRDDGLYVSATNTCQGATGSQLPPLSGRGCVEVELPSLSLANGRYLLSVGAYAAPDAPFWTNPADFHDRAYRFHVESDHYVHGLLALQANWRLIEGG